MAFRRHLQLFFIFFAKGRLARPTRTRSHATYRRCLDPTKSLRRRRAAGVVDMPVCARLALARGCPPRSLSAKTTIKKLALVLCFQINEKRSWLATWSWRILAHCCAGTISCALKDHKGPKGSVDGPSCVVNLR